MSCDKLVYDLSSETEGSPNVFVRKDWINILDNQTQNYQSNQSVIDTSQLSNSNKWMSYREAYCEIPLLLTIACDTAGAGTISTLNDAGTAVAVGGEAGFVGYDPDTALTTAPIKSGALSIGLKNWFGQIIHSFTLDYNGTTIIQQTPFINMWNSFKLMTTLSWQDVLTQGAHIGFYPDKSTSWSYSAVSSACGEGTANNGLFPGYGSDFCPQFFTANDGSAVQPIELNEGYTKRMAYITFDPSAVVGALTFPPATNAAGFAGQPATWVKARDLMPVSTSTNMWRSHLSGRKGAAGVKGFVQNSIMATVYLKHIHSFFNMVPLLKGVYMKMTMNLNNSTSTLSILPAIGASATVPYQMGKIALTSVSTPVGGVNPLMVSSSNGGQTPNKLEITSGPAVLSSGTLPVQYKSYSGGAPLTAFLANALPVTTAQTYYANISVGSVVLDPTTSGIVGQVGSGQVAKSIYLYVPAYTFNPVFEQAYLSSPVKTIKYTDVYQYQVKGVEKDTPFNNLITNGIANIKSVLILPFYSPDDNGIASKVPCYGSPFDPAGTGTTSPLIALNNFNVVISGQNAIYNTERYTFEHFVNQVYGQNAVNGGLTDGLTSSLINFKDWQSSYCYYYTNVERMLPVEQTVPKSVQIQGINASGKKIDLWVFVEYGTQIQVDAITGARV